MVLLRSYAGQIVPLFASEQLAAISVASTPHMKRTERRRLTSRLEKMAGRKKQRISSSQLGDLGVRKVGT